MQFYWALSQNDLTQKAIEKIRKHKNAEKKRLKEFDLSSDSTLLGMCHASLQVKISRVCLKNKGNFYDSRKMMEF